MHKTDGKKGQVMLEYMVVLLSVVLMYFMLRMLLHTFNTSGARILELITWKYP